MTATSPSDTADWGIRPSGREVGLVPTHPERTDDPDTLRWHSGLFVHDEDAGALAGLVRAGLLSRFTTAGGISTTLAPGVGWAQAGPRVRAAVQATLESARDGHGLDADGRDKALARAAQEVIADLVGPVAAGHGGSVRLISVRDGVVTVRMAGACRGCPAATRTLQAGLADALRARVPWLREVRAAEPPTLGT